jgi:hypothetical protein
VNTAIFRSLPRIAVLLVAPAFAAQGAGDVADERVSRSAAGYSHERPADELRDPQTLELSRTPVAVLTIKPRASTSPARSATIASVSSGDAWIYDATTDLFRDYDGDGYYHYLRVRFDADTIYDHTYVYAEIYISADGSAWEHLFTTDDFAIWGSDPDDDYEVETELVSGYSTGLYDVLIELYDADDGVLVDEFGPAESSDFSLLPLEDSYRDGAGPGPSPIVHGDGGGGTVPWWLLPALLVAVAARRRR